MYYVTLNLNARFQPMDRHELEDALDEIMNAENLGGLDGGGTLLAKNGEVAECDIEIVLNEAGGVERLKEIVEVLGVPKGSKIKSEDSEIAVGRLEGLALYVNGSDLPDEVYETCDINHVVESIENLLGDDLSFFSYAELETETALYFYGTSFSAMKDKISAFVAEYPLCEKSRIVQIA